MGRDALKRNHFGEVICSHGLSMGSGCNPCQRKMYQFCPKDGKDHNFKFHSRDGDYHDLVQCTKCKLLRSIEP